MYTKYLKYLLLSLWIPSCFMNCQEDVFSAIEFPETVYLTNPEVRMLEDVNLIYPYRIRKDSMGIYVMDLHAADYYCFHLGYPSMKLKRSLAKKGIGPEEFLDAENIRLTKTSACWTLDANRNSFYCFLSEDTTWSQEVSLDNRLIQNLDFEIYKDSLFIVPDGMGEYRFNILSPDGKIKDRRGQIPLRKKDKNISDIAYAQAWRGFLSYNDENGVLALVTQLGEVMQIYDLPGDSLINTVYGKEGSPRFTYRDGFAIPDGIMGYSDVYVGKKSIYTLFWGYSFDDIKRNVVTTEGGNIIRVFDLKGNPMKQYLLDRLITGFHIDEEEGILIGLDVNSDQPIVEWNMT